MQHSYNRGPFVVRYAIKNLIDFRRVANGHFNWMRVVQRIQFKGCCKSVGHKLLPYVIFPEKMIDTKKLNERSETFI